MDHVPQSISNTRSLWIIDDYGLQWVSMECNGQLWVTMSVYGVQWTTMGYNEYLWYAMDDYGPLWCTMGYHEGQRHE